MSGDRAWSARLGDLLPPSVGIVLRARLGPSREAEMRLIRTFLRSGEVGVDVGANKGTWTQEMRRRVGPSGRVIACEPQSSLVQYLIAGFSGRPEVEIRSCALSDQPGSLYLRIPLDNGRPIRGHASLEDDGREAVHELVSVVTLDDVVGDRTISFVKIDVEGHEEGVVNGGWRVLERDRPALVIEMTDYRSSGPTARCFARLVTELGYEAAYLQGDQLVRMASWPPRVDLGTPNVVFAQSLPTTIR